MAKATANLRGELPSSKDAALALTQKIRYQMVLGLTDNGESVPDTKEEVAMLSAVLNDMDRQVLTLKRLETDELIGGNMAAAVLGEIAELSKGKNIFKAKDGAPTESRADTFDKSRVPTKTPVEGEMEVGIKEENYTTFMDGYTGKKSDS